MEPFSAPRLKIKRANRHISEVEAIISAFQKEKPFKLVAKSHMQGIKLVIRVKKDIPHDLPAVIGDVIHNLRAALDLLACDLVRLNGGNFDGVYFPFASTGSDLGTMIQKRHIDRAAPDVVDIIRSFKPYKGGNEALRAIHELDIADKHKLLIPVVYFAGIPDLTVTSGDSVLLSLRNNWIGRIKNDMAIITLPTAQNIQMGKEFQMAFAIAFGQEQPFVENKAIVPTLHQLSQLVDGIVQTLEAHCLGR